MSENEPIYIALTKPQHVDMGLLRTEWTSMREQGVPMYDFWYEWGDMFMRLLTEIDLTPVGEQK